MRSMMTARTRRFLCISLLGLSAFSTSQSQAANPTRLAIGVGLQGRGVGGFHESRIGPLAEVLLRLPHERAAWNPRAAVGLAHFGTPNDVTGLVCNPDGPPCEYYAPAITLAAGALGGEWPAHSQGMRAIVALTAYHVLSAPLRSPGAGVPDARHGVRTSAGAQVGIIAPMRRAYPRGEVELRFEWLAQPIESTRHFVPLIARFAW